MESGRCCRLEFHATAARGCARRLQPSWAARGLLLPLFRARDRIGAVAQGRWRGHKEGGEDIRALAMPTLTAAPQPPHALGSQNDAPDNSLCDPPPRSAALRAASPRLWRHRCTCGAPREAGAGRRGVHTDFEKGRKMTHSKIDFAKRHPDLRRGAARRGDDRWCMAIRSSAGKLAVQQPGCPGNSLRLATTSSSRRHGAIDAGPNRRDATYARARAEMRALVARACRRCPPHVAGASRCRRARMPVAAARRHVAPARVCAPRSGALW